MAQKTELALSSRGVKAENALTVYWYVHLYGNYGFTSNGERYTSPEAAREYAEKQLKRNPSLLGAEIISAGGDKWRTYIDSTTGMVPIGHNGTTVILGIDYWHQIVRDQQQLRRDVETCNRYSGATTNELRAMRDHAEELAELLQRVSSRPMRTADDYTHEDWQRDVADVSEALTRHKQLVYGHHFDAPDEVA